MTTNQTPSLKQLLTDIIKDAQEHYNDPATNYVNRAISAIDKRDEVALGENDGKLGRFSPVDWYNIRNELRSEIRTNLKKSLGIKL